VLAAAIALTATTAYFYLGIISPAVPVYHDPPGGTYAIPNATAFVVKVSGKQIDVSANVSVTAYYAQFPVPIFIVNTLPQGVIIEVDPKLKLRVANLTEGLYATVVFTDAGGAARLMCSALSASALGNGLYLLAPTGTGNFTLANEACKKLSVNYDGAWYDGVWDGTVTVDAAAGAMHVKYYECETGYLKQWDLNTYSTGVPFTLTADAIRASAVVNETRVYVLARPVFAIGVVTSADTQLTVSAQPGP
jgi:hypothetical protein